MMPSFKKDFELRRVIFGLTAILRTNPQALPAIVTERLPELTRQLALLSLAMREERMKILKDNEDHLAKGIKGFNDDDEDEDLEGMEAADDDESDSEFQDTIKKIQKYKKEVAEGKR
jgi:hypothetical protein